MRRDRPSAGHGTYYNLDEPLVYLRVGFSNSTWLQNFTNDQALLEVRVDVKHTVSTRLGREWHERFRPTLSAAAWYDSARCLRAGCAPDASVPCPSADVDRFRCTFLTVLPVRSCVRPSDAGELFVG